jgi:hypothetical protein
VSQKKIEQRCRHGFLRSEVDCPICDREAVPRQKAELTAIGCTVAGVEVVAHLPKRRCVVRCPCGNRYEMHRASLVRSEARGRSSRCTQCHEAVRSKLIREGMAKASAA